MRATLVSVLAVENYAYPLHLRPQVRGERRRQAKACRTAVPAILTVLTGGDIDQNPYGTHWQPTISMRSPIGLCARCKGFDLNLP